MRRHPQTRIVMPLDVEQAVNWSLTLAIEQDDRDELEWCFDDQELTRSLRAIKSGRLAPIALLVAAMAALATALVVLG